MNLAREGKDGKSSSRPKDGSESFSENESGEDADAPKRKRGRPRTVKRDEVEGFNDAEVRRYSDVYFYEILLFSDCIFFEPSKMKGHKLTFSFIIRFTKSYKKFARPRTRYI